ncbi:hypothetical protein ZOSMA_327G00090 [Zostera marina]|uniref:Uncharacterized protein n=1 Tax=Zostera marina TaxID=29655 RepID=A0A0K9PAR2_ZOSMR|nr:hypothetical protein ZOSMA_327G00090 [Zostera marina]
MEGLIPMIYRAIVQYTNGGDLGSEGSSLHRHGADSPSGPYMRLSSGKSDSRKFCQPEHLQVSSESALSSSISSIPPHSRKISTINSGSFP